MKPQLSRPQMIGLVAKQVPIGSVDDLPMIRQAVNDTADAYRKDGWLVSDFAQDIIVRAIQRRIKDKGIEFYCRNRETT